MWEDNISNFKVFLPVDTPLITESQRPSFHGTDEWFPDTGNISSVEASLVSEYLLDVLMSLFQD